MGKVIRTNTKGKILYDTIEEMYHVEFGSVYLTLDFYQYHELEEIVEKLNVVDELSNKDNRIKIPFESDNFSWLLSPDDVIDLKDLFGVLESGAEKQKLKLTFSMN